MSGSLNEIAFFPGGVMNQVPPEFRSQDGRTNEHGLITLHLKCFSDFEHIQSGPLE